MSEDATREPSPREATFVADDGQSAFYGLHGGIEAGKPNRIEAQVGHLHQSEKACPGLVRNEEYVVIDPHAGTFKRRFHALPDHFRNVRLNVVTEDEAALRHSARDFDEDRVVAGE